MTFPGVVADLGLNFGLLVMFVRPLVLMVRNDARTEVRSARHRARRLSQTQSSYKEDLNDALAIISWIWTKIRCRKCPARRPGLMCNPALQNPTVIITAVAAPAQSSQDTAVAAPAQSSKDTAVPASSSCPHTAVAASSSRAKVLSYRD